MDIADSGAWSLGTLIWMPVVTVLVIGLVVLGVWLSRKARSGDLDSYDAPWAKGAAIACYVLAVGFVIGTAAPVTGMWPYKGEYHQWREVSGEVAKIDKRLLGSGSGVEEKFVVVFEGSSQQFGCTDTRCASIEEGDRLTLSCKRAWEWAATDGYDCRYIGYEPA